MRIFFDDERDKPSHYDHVLRTYEDFCVFFLKNQEQIEEISFDYYLFGVTWTGEDALKFVLEFLKDNNKEFPRIHFHSSDRAARFRMKEMLRNAKGFKNA